MSKRDDLQWLRALAIIAVVSFHLQPKIFPFGYLGVDIFFVISGYLMTSILSKSSDTVTFYLRRIKRIFPVYFLTITVFFVIGFFKLLPSHFDFLKSEVLWSIFFLNNFPPMLEKKEYFQMISEFKFLLHTWSLSVEIQFYLMAPFLIKFILSKNYSSLKWTFTIASFSFLLQTFIPNNAVAFGLVFCRIWQFLIGTFTFLHADYNFIEYQLVIDRETTYESFELENDTFKKFEIKKFNDNIGQSSAFMKPSGYKENNYIIFAAFVTLLFICFNSFIFSTSKIDVYMMRLITTILTGFFITVNNSRPFYIPKLINSVIVYIGDISYVIYLIHWPIIIFFKYLHISYGDIFTIISVLATTLFIHECFEKPIGKLSWICNIAVITIFLITIFVFSIIGPNKTLTSFDLIHDNELEAASCKKFYYQDSCVTNPLIEKYLTSRPKADVMDRYCSIKLNPKASNKTIIITGNSFVHFQIRGIIEGIKQSKTKFSEAFVIEHPQCNLLVGYLNSIYKECTGLENTHDQLFSKIRPDVIIHSARIDFFFPSENASIFNYMNDTYYDAIKSQILHIANFTRRLIIIEPHPPFSNDNKLNPINVAYDIFINNSRRSHNISLKEFHKRHDPGWNRVKEAVKHCSNCVIIPTKHIMCPNKICSVVDPITQLSVFCDQSHMAPTNSLKLVPGIIKAIDNSKIV